MDFGWGVIFVVPVVRAASVVISRAMFVLGEGVGLAAPLVAFVVSCLGSWAEAGLFIGVAAVAFCAWVHLG